MARGLIFCIKEVEALYYLCSENRGADQLRGYREADLRLCFHICKKPVFSRRGSNKTGVYGASTLHGHVCMMSQQGRGPIQSFAHLGQLTQKCAYL